MWHINSEKARGLVIVLLTSSRIYFTVSWGPGGFPCGSVFEPVSPPPPDSFDAETDLRPFIRRTVISTTASTEEDEDDDYGDDNADYLFTVISSILTNRYRRWRCLNRGGGVERQRDSDVAAAADRASKRSKAERGSTLFPGHLPPPRPLARLFAVRNPSSVYIICVRLCRRRRRGVFVASNCTRRRYCRRSITF